MSIPANSIDWPPICEGVLRASYGSAYDDGSVTVMHVRWVLDDGGIRFLGYRNFGQDGLRQMKEIIEREHER